MINAAQQFGQFVRRQIAPLAYRQAAKFNVHDARPLQPAHLVPEGGAHAANLAVEPCVKMMRNVRSSIR